MFQGFELNLPYDVTRNQHNGRHGGNDRRPPAGFQHHSYEQDVKYAEELRALKASGPNGGRGDHLPDASDAGEAVRLCHAAQLLQEQVRAPPTACAVQS